jgi:hypothetical protein
MCTYIYKKMGKERKGKKEKDFSVKRTGGDFGPAKRPRRRARPPQLSLPTGHGTGTSSWARAHMPARGGERRQGEKRGPPAVGRNRPLRSRRRFFTGDPILGGWGGGIARAGVGGHGGGVNLAGGSSGRPVHGAVVGSSVRVLA